MLMPTVAMGCGLCVFVNLLQIYFSFKLLRLDRSEIPSSLIAKNVAGVIAHTLTSMKKSSMYGLLKELESMGMFDGVVCDEGCFSAFVWMCQLRMSNYNEKRVIKL